MSEAKMPHFSQHAGGKYTLLKLPARTYKVVFLLALTVMNETIHYIFTGFCSDQLEHRTVLFLCSCEPHDRCAHSPEAQQKMRHIERVWSQRD